jgi:cell shape-determining protein MreC
MSIVDDFERELHELRKLNAEKEKNRKELAKLYEQRDKLEQGERD